MTALLQLRGVALAGRVGPIDADVRTGELLYLLGPNGAGKSSLLALMAGLEQGQGNIDFAGQPLAAWSAPALAARRAYLCQQQTPPFAMPLWRYLQLHQHAEQGEPAMLAIAESLWLSDKLTRPVSALSGGEWQRARLAAVLLQIDPNSNPQGQLLLLDEPMNSLDVAQQAALDRLLGGLCRAGVTVVMSGHDLNHSLRHAGRVWLLHNGRLAAEGAPVSVLTPLLLESVYGLPFRSLEVEGTTVLLTSY
ncbi:vitamin B12 ABC transporter ATP-binding protein BtuD [Erwinia sp. CPCC 100877]|nr:vitamin B12 ABC transporter ATP-binding protein BtuD [Erwinia sp. CPCC 100877]